MLMRWDPFTELDRLTEGLWSGLRRPAVPIDAYRSGEAFVVHFDLPGIDPSSIELTVQNNVLTVRAERQGVAEGEVLISERPVGTFTRQLFLGQGLNTDALKANYRNGVLTVTIPVAEEAKPRRIEISAGEAPKAIETSATAAA